MARAHCDKHSTCTFLFAELYPPIISTYTSILGRSLIERELWQQPICIDRRIGRVIGSQLQAQGSYSQFSWRHEASIVGVYCQNTHMLANNLSLYGSMIVTAIRGHGG